MPEENGKTIRIPIKGEEGKHTDHNIRTIIISASEGIKALYCTNDKKIITYLFSERKDWDMPKANEWVSAHTKRLKSLSEITIDQDKEFLKIVAVMDDGDVDHYIPKTAPFVLSKDIELFTTGCDEENLKMINSICDGTIIFEKSGDSLPEWVEDAQGQLKDMPPNAHFTVMCRSCKSALVQCRCDKKDKSIIEVTCDACKACGDKKPKDSIEKDAPGEDDVKNDTIIKVDKAKQIVYGVFLVPEEADHDGDVVSVDDVEMVAHKFVSDYRKIDEMHNQLINAEIVESGIAWKDGLDYYGKTLTKGTWFGAIKINDASVWEKVDSGELKAFSVRIIGRREDIKPKA